MDFQVKLPRGALCATVACLTFGTGAIVVVPVASAAVPDASFIFEPSTPGVGEQVTFSSTSTDADGPLDASAQVWDLDGDGQFGDAAGPSVTHSFNAPGDHVVSLQVTDADSNSTVATR